jgi:hypothetical protein
MANSATKSPNFTPANAREMQRRSTASRLTRIAHEKAEAQAMKAALARIPESEDARRNRTLKQIDQLDGLIDRALNLGQQDRFLKLSKAKGELWKLVQPTAGSLRPGSRRRSQDVPRMVPIDPTTPQEPPTSV